MTIQVLNVYITVGSGVEVHTVKRAFDDATCAGDAQTALLAAAVSLGISDNVRIVITEITVET